jgi:hypothetical protein
LNFKVRDLMAEPFFFFYCCFHNIFLKYIKIIKISIHQNDNNNNNNNNLNQTKFKFF